MCKSKKDKHKSEIHYCANAGCKRQIRVRRASKPSKRRWAAGVKGHDLCRKCAESLIDAGKLYSPRWVDKRPSSIMSRHERMLERERELAVLNQEARNARAGRIAALLNAYDVSQIVPECDDEAA